MKKAKVTIKTHSKISKHVHTRKNPKQNMKKINNKKIGKGRLSKTNLHYIRKEIMNIHSLRHNYKTKPVNGRKIKATIHTEDTEESKIPCRK